MLTVKKRDDSSVAIAQAKASARDFAKQNPSHRIPTVIYLTDDYKLEKNALHGDNIEIIPIKSPSPARASGGEREVVTAFGPSGAGKSHVCKQYVKNYKKLWPKRDVFILSKVVGDPTFDDISDMVDFIPLDISVIMSIELGRESPDSLDPCLIVFDDIDAIEDKSLNLAVSNLLKSVLELGRHNQVSAFITQHLIGTGTDQKRSRTILNETHRVFVFPAASSTSSLEYFLTKHVGISKDESKIIKSLPSRWVCIHRRYPLYYVWSEGIAMVK